jgi:hypothetical protein
MRSNNHSQSLLKVIEQTTPKLLSVSGDTLNSKPAGMNWTRKEILGHLIDSASNNHHRFIRIQFESTPFQIVSYVQNEWVEKNAYQTQKKEILISLWNAYNIHLAHIIDNIPESKLNAECILKDNKKVTLEFIIKDYIDHMIHHLDQIITH